MLRAKIVWLIFQDHLKSKLIKWDVAPNCIHVTHFLGTRLGGLRRRMENGNGGQTRLDSLLAAALCGVQVPVEVPGLREHLQALRALLRLLGLLDYELARFPYVVLRYPLRRVSPLDVPRHAPWVEHQCTVWALNVFSFHVRENCAGEGEKAGNLINYNFRCDR